MFEFIYSAIAVACYLACAVRIICFDSKNRSRHRLHEVIAMMLIASFAGQSVNIIFLKDPVTIWDAFFGLVLFVIIFKAKGNTAFIFRGTSS